MKSNEVDFLLGAVVGGLIGGITALLFFPKREKKAHKELRKKMNVICEQSRELIEKVEEIEEVMCECCKSKKMFSKSKSEDF